MYRKFESVSGIIVENQIGEQMHTQYLEELV